VHDLRLEAQSGSRRCPDRGDRVATTQSEGMLQMALGKLEPEAQRIHDLMADRPAVASLTPDEAREQSRARRLLVNRPSEPVDEVIEASIEGPHGEIPLRCYYPSPGLQRRERPSIVFFHGGGWVVGDLDGHDSLCRLIANRVKANVISVDYHLAPEYPFPIPIEEAAFSFSWVVDHAEELAIDGSRVAVAGDSSGGNLAAASCILLRDQGGHQPVAQLLIYPVVQCELRPEAYDSSLETAFLTGSAMAWYCRHYLVNPDDAKQAYASPLQAERVDDLPPAVVVLAEFDVLTPQIKAYCDRLRNASVPVVALEYDGVFHGFINMSAEMSSAANALDECTSTFSAVLRAH
jgi:acetyl esterase